MVPPTIRITNATTERKETKTIDPHRLLKELGQLRKDNKQLRDQVAEIREDIQSIPKFRVRDQVAELIHAPHRYETRVLPAKFYSMVRCSSAFYGSMEDEELGYQPALVKITWRDGGELFGLNETEVELLKKHNYWVYRDTEKGFNKQSEYHLCWVEKKPNTLWLTFLQEDIQGPSWCYCMARHISSVRNQERVKWTALVQLPESLLRLSPDEMDSTESMIRESMIMMLSHRTIVDTIPWEVRSDEGLQVALSSLRTEARKVITSSEDYEAAVLAEKRRVDYVTT